VRRPRTGGAGSSGAPEPLDPASAGATRRSADPAAAVSARPGADIAGRASGGGLRAAARAPHVIAAAFRAATGVPLTGASFRATARASAAPHPFRRGG
jgi:hypothetical protein